MGGGSLLALGAKAGIVTGSFEGGCDVTGELGGDDLSRGAALEDGDGGEGLVADSRGWSPFDRMTKEGFSSGKRPVACNEHLRNPLAPQVPPLR
jgi:hypothetical protein